MPESKQPRSESPPGTGGGSLDLEPILAECLEQIELEGPECIDAFCARFPALEVELRDRLRWLFDVQLIDSEDRTPERIGPYRVVSTLGAGGMGEVFLAEQDEPSRMVAVKVIQLARTTDRLLARFAVEVQVLAMLEHEHIARVYEAGRTSDGRPYFAMEFVDGVPITTSCDDQRLDVRQRLELFLEACRAIEYAHRRSVVHRDVKPSNILVREADDGPHAKVIDFGLAKVLGREFGDDQQRSQPGQLVGTLRYMSPEQAEGQLTVDTRTDVYSLGVLLYELLTGAPPLALDSDSRSHKELVEEIRRVDPPPPSRRHAQRRDAGESVPVPQPPDDDLDAIVMAALEKDPERRYASVTGLIADLENFLAHRPVTARRQTRGYRVAKFIRRNRMAVGMAALFLVLLVSGATWITLLFLDRDRKVEEFEMMGRVRALRILDERERSTPVKARREGIQELEAWIREVELIFAERSRFLEVRDRIQDSDPASQLELRDALRGLIARADAMTSESGTLPHARRRLAWARVVRKLTVEDYADRWERAREAVVADERFGGFELDPIAGLAPLGTGYQGLQEFAFLIDGGELPIRRKDGSFAIGEKTCPVLVLLPGELFTPGASDDKKSVYYDPFLLPNDEPIGAPRRIKPFLIGRHEFTHGQWLLLTGENLVERGQREDPRACPAVPLDRPAVRFDFPALTRLLGGWGLDLPWADEWDYAARAGTRTPWWCGPKLSDVEGNANLGDVELFEGGTVEGEHWKFRDGHKVPAPVGSFPPNAFGLHDVHGNASELVDAVREDGTRALDARGGNWHQGWRVSRIASRFNWRGAAKYSIGFRPVIRIPLVTDQPPTLRKEK